MRYPCSENKLIENLALRFQNETGLPAEYFEEMISNWKERYCVQLSGSEVQETIKPLKISEIGINEKLPKALFRRIADNEQLMGIESINCSARIDYIHNDYASVKITGTFVGKPRKDEVTMIVMVYNGNNELLGYEEECYTFAYEGEENTFDVKIGFPSDEWISAVEIRFTPKSPLFVF